MDDKNSFLSSYKNRAQEQKPEEAREVPPAGQAPPSLHYEQKSGFTRPRARELAAAPPPGGRKLTPWITGAILLIAVAAGLFLLLNRGVKVIDFTGWTLNDAQLWASENGVRLKVDEQYNDTVDAGKIAHQNPAEGGALRKGDFLSVTVSLGHDLTVTLPLPDLKSMTKSEIEKWASDNFMTKVRITAEYSDSVEAGRVISFEVNDNTVVDAVRRNSPVYVIVSKGPEDLDAVLIALPDFRQKSVAESFVFAEEHGLVLKVEERYDDYSPKGSITGQSHKADEKVKKGTEITITVSKGKQILIPDFSGFSKQKATSVASELGIPAAFAEKYSSLKSGDFISQSIQAGTVYEEGDVLELSYSLGNKIIVPNFVGQTRDAVEAWAKELNDQGAGISISVSQTQSNQPKGRILHQSRANTVVGIKTTIGITVSLGKAVFVPDFVAPEGSGYDVAITRDKAIAMCEALNLVPIFVKSTKAGRLPGEIWYQSIAAGKEVTEETTITLKYNPVTVTYSVPNFNGMTEAEILAAGYLKKFDIKFEIAEAAEPGYEGKVFRQSAAPGTSVAAGTAITLTVGPEP